MVRYLILSTILLYSVLAFGTEDYAFRGDHFIASYYDCSEEAICNDSALEDAMIEAIEASGAVILDLTSHHFHPSGLTVVFLLAESHASIHTYPEHRCCFVDLFTCGDSCNSEEFDRFLRQYLQPRTVKSNTLMRN